MLANRLALCDSCLALGVVVEEIRDCGVGEGTLTGLCGLPRSGDGSGN
jgi:hypothetical protein